MTAPDELRYSIVDPIPGQPEGRDFGNDGQPYIERFRWASPVLR